MTAMQSSAVLNDVCNQLTETNADTFEADEDGLVEHRLDLALEVGKCCAA